jgi:regulatory protein
MELTRLLEKRGFDPGAAGEAVAVLEREGWLDDAAAARSAARARAGRYGRERLSRELAARGFSPETVRVALEDVDPEGEEKALSRLFARLRRSSAGLPRETRRRRIWNALVRRGFSKTAISAKMKDWRGDDEA